MRAVNKLNEKMIRVNVYLLTRYPQSRDARQLLFVHIPVRYLGVSVQKSNAISN
jgi:hypothetical protein